MTALCHCGGTGGYDACCRPLHRGDAEAATAEEVMRARYSAHVVGDRDYLESSWHPDTRPPVIVGLGDGDWLGLTVERTERGDRLDADGVVAFVARFRPAADDAVTELRETSRFGRHGGRWVYLDGR